MMRALKISTDTIVPEVRGKENPIPLSIAKQTLIPEVKGKEVSLPVSLYYEAYKQ